MSNKELRQMGAYIRDNQHGIYRRLDVLEFRMSAAMDELKAAVQDNRNVTASAVQLLEGLTRQLQVAANNEDLPAIHEILDNVKADTAELANAVAANTPVVAAPAPTPVPPADPLPTPDPVPTPTPSDPSVPTG